MAKVLEGPASILGGLPVWAECSVHVSPAGPWGPAEYDMELDDLFWQKKDGSKGGRIPDHIWESASQKDPYWQAYVTEAVSDYVAYGSENPFEDGVRALKNEPAG